MDYGLEIKKNIMFNYIKSTRGLLCLMKFFLMSL
jgi:hypothetical protein